MTDKPSRKWRFWIDRGGTFTDVVAVDPKSELHTKKLLSENPESYEDAALEGIRQFLGTPKNEPLPGHIRQFLNPLRQNGNYSRHQCFA